MLRNKKKQTIVRNFELFTLNNFKYLLCCSVNNALTGLMINMQTIMIGKIEMELPAMYMINRFMGTCLRGPSARSQDFLIIR